MQRGLACPAGRANVGPGGDQCADDRETRTPPDRDVQRRQPPGTSRGVDIGTSRGQSRDIESFALGSGPVQGGESQAVLRVEIRAGIDQHLDFSGGGLAFRPRRTGSIRHALLAYYAPRRRPRGVQCVYHAPSSQNLRSLPKSSPACVEQINRP